jgi:Ferrochelatase
VLCILVLAHDVLIAPSARHRVVGQGEATAGINQFITRMSVDCLETLEEIAIRYASLYRPHGGGELRYIPALNDSPGHIKSLLRRHLRGWAPGPRIS